MKRLMIGQYDKFDIRRQDRDFRDYFYGIEINSMESEEELIKLKEYLDGNRNINIGVHFPLLKDKTLIRDPQYLSKNKNIYNEAIKYIKYQFELASKYNVDYILLHYPKPVILDGNVDWSIWRFIDDSEFYYESEITYEYLRQKSYQFFEWLSGQGKKYNFTPVLEFDALNKYVYDTNLVECLLEKYPNIKLCLDFMRIHFQSKIDKNFRDINIIKKFGKYTYLVHLSNIKINKKAMYRHFPALKDLKVSDGWGDMALYINELNKVNKNYKLLFEHNSYLIKDEELEQCYNWINKLIND